VRLYQVRRRDQGLIESLQGVSVLLQPEEDPAALELVVGQFVDTARRLPEADCFVQVRQRLRVGTSRFVQPRARPVQCCGWRQGDRLVQLRQRFLQAAAAQVGLRQIGVRLRLLRPHPRGALQVGHRRVVAGRGQVVLPPGLAGPPEPAQRPRPLLVPHPLAKAHHGAVDAQAVMFHVVGRQLLGRVEVGKGGLEIAQLPVDEAAQQVRPDQRRLHAHAGR